MKWCFKLEYGTDGRKLPGYGQAGTFNTDWKYEISGNYGEFDERTRVLGNIDVQRLGLALDARRGPNGNIVCGSQLNAANAAPDLASRMEGAAFQGKITMGGCAWLVLTLL